MMVVRSIKSAERRNSPWDNRNHRKGKAYCALLKRGPRDTIDREFVKRTKSYSGSEILLSVETQPGDIYEIRRWWFDHDRKAYLGGTVWIGIDEHNRPFVLTRDEAFSSVLSPPIRQHSHASSTLISILPARVLPAGVDFS